MIEKFIMVTIMAVMIGIIVGSIMAAVILPSMYNYVFEIGWRRYYCNEYVLEDNQLYLTDCLWGDEFVIENIKSL